MSGSGQLAEYLQACRARLRPQDVGLDTYGERRRVPGLRREEVAGLAGVSASYYIRLEQGQSLNASNEVIDGIARALRLDPDEREHLRALARPRRRAVPPPPVEHVAPATAELMASMAHVPAVLLGRRTDVLAWNPLGHALFAGHLDQDAPRHPDERPNMARLVFLDAHTRELYPRWEVKARAMVGHLRLVAGRHPEDRELSTLIGELVTGSEEFAAMWADHRVRECDNTEHRMRHPLVGELTVKQQALLLPHAPEHRLTFVTAEQGSPSQAALTLLARAVEGRAARTMST
ncbi:helix-turn-helix domain-containing protein [Saccharothrix coeruleofusca]|uniref:Transcriptional regulator n=1 Tax=Saccharothrix coeruleofusca TaxID=33919 RepID=A0A918EIF1_9PSEU|nr:helix-turn-helix transcriptional regulator [Saccharothrix coeruleofusca]MBP2338844.1 transcriptional regulator with XRE-family HTH domain [Saccharothrix coeruleofusca]GGP85795.1 transcriptional regulator [Saccharothrix coeruleofusca]